MTSNAETKGFETAIAQMGLSKPGCNPADVITIGQMLEMSRSVTDEDVDVFQNHIFERLFGFTTLGAHGESLNSDGYMEGEEEPHLQFEQAIALSGTYLLSMTPVLREDKVYAYVKADRTNDGMGFGSKSWETILEDSLDAEENETIAAFALRVTEKALEFRIQLLEQVCAQGAAKDGARRDWADEEAKWAAEVEAEFANAVESAAPGL